MKGRISIVCALWFLMLVNYLDRVAMSFAGPVIMKSMVITPATFGLILSSFVMGLFLTQIPGGILTDRLGSKLFLVVGPLLWGLFTGLTGLIASVGGLMFVRAGLGAAEGISGASIWKTIGDNFEPRQRPKVVALFLSAAAVGPIFAGPLIGLMLHAHGWQMVFMVLAVPSLLAALLSFLLIPAKPARAVHDRAVEAIDAVSLRNVFGRPTLWLLSIAGLAMNIADWGYLAWMPSYLSLARHIDIRAVGILSSIPYAVAFVGMLCGGWIGARWHHLRAQWVIFTYLGAGLSLLLAYRSGTLPMSLVGLSGVAFFLFASHAPKGSLALDVAPQEHRGAYMATVNMVSQVGGIIAPVTIGLLVTKTGSFAAGFTFMIGALCVGAGCMLALIPLLPAKLDQATSG